MVNLPDTVGVPVICAVPSPLSTNDIPAVAPSTPAAPAITSKTATSISLPWTAPDNGGRPITDYRIEYSTDGTIWTVFADSFSTSTTATVTEPVAGSTYRLRVSAINAEGTGAASAASAVTSLVGVPQSPANIAGVWSSTTSPVVSWTAPADGVADALFGSQDSYDQTCDQSVERMQKAPSREGA